MPNSIPIPDALTTRQQVKLLVGIPQVDTLEDALIDMQILAASALITNSCNRTHFLSTNAANPITEYYSGDGTSTLIINQYPITSVTSVYADDNAYYGSSVGAFGAQTLLTQGSDYCLAVDFCGAVSERGIIYRLNGGVWNTRYVRDAGMLSAIPANGRGNIQVTYTCGYPTLPTDLSYAAAIVVARMRSSSTYGQEMASESFEEYSYTLKANEDNLNLGLLGGQVSQILAQYRIASVGMF